MKKNSMNSLIFFFDERGSSFETGKKLTTIVTSSETKELKSVNTKTFNELPLKLLRNSS